MRKPDSTDSTDGTDISIGSVVHLTIDNGDGGIAIVLENKKINKPYDYKVYRLPPHDDFMLVADWECYVVWQPP